MRQLYESRRYDEGTALEANGASVGSDINDWLLFFYLM